MSSRQFIIISGGQTGVDRGALDAALAAGVACGGWCPAGRRAEDGAIAAVYPLRETASPHYQVRTRQNVIDSDGTLLIYFGVLEGGSAKTLEFCRELHKPVLCLDAQSHSPAQAAARIAAFIAAWQIGILNVAGPRASKQAQAQHYTAHTIALLLNKVCATHVTTS
jgi:predicted Rossmann fold nucleotide-binding protein DprA/Smf involved in DNA uptake